MSQVFSKADATAGLCWRTGSRPSSREILMLMRRLGPVSVAPAPTLAVTSASDEGALAAVQRGRRGTLS